MPKADLVFLAAFRELAGVDRQSVTASSPRQALADLGLLDAIEAQTPIVAVNQVISGLDHELNDGDEVAIMPPMTGG